MSTEAKDQAVARRDPPQFSLAELNEMGAVFVKSGYFKDARDAAQAVVKIMYGRELGFSPVIAMSGIHIIEGKPSLSANLMGAMVKRSGKYNYRVKELTDTNCVLVFTENCQEIGESSFSMADAQRAQVVRAGGSWSKYPRNMMFARALSNGVKLFCPDLSMCPIYNPEELGAEVNEEGAVISHPVAAPTVTTQARVIGKAKAETVVVSAVEPFVPAPSFGEPLIRPADPALAAFNAEHQPVVDGASDKLEMISQGEAANFAKEFRMSLAPGLRPLAESLRHEWLAKNGFIDGDGNPSAKMIVKKDFIATRDRACAFAAEQKEAV